MGEDATSHGVRRNDTTVNKKLRILMLVFLHSVGLHFLTRGIRLFSCSVLMEATEGYDMFDMHVITGDDVAQTSREILHDLLNYRNMDAVNDLLNDYFHFSNDFEIITVCTIYL
ncbi:hypothetical protein TNCV_5020331 [Trichonephila clavipes]|nr:hypothetical protein TNCV_5020331 [Trichonephila clavipes]